LPKISMAENHELNLGQGRFRPDPEKKA